MAPVGTYLKVRARPGAAREGLRWDPWREVWVVSVATPPTRGLANRRILELVTRWLGLPTEAVTWKVAGRSREKVLWISGQDAETVDRRLRAVAAAATDRPEDAVPGTG